MADKNRERAILAMVYDRAEFQELPREEDERPDFVMRRADATSAFGVEVTELYESGTFARIRRVPTYVSSVLSGGKVRHKDDVDILRLRRVEVTDAAGNHKGSAEMIIYNKVVPEQYVILLADAISRKGAKLHHYDEAVSHTNLVILDTTGVWRGSDKANIGWNMLGPKVVSELLQTVYREIIVVTDVGAGGWVCVPLKAHYIVSSAMFFESAINATEAEITDAAVWLDRFAAFLGERGASVQRIRDVVSGPGVIFGNTGVGLVNRSFVVYDLAETIISSVAEPVTCTSAVAAKTLHAKFDELADSHGFTFGGVGDALEAPPI